MALYATGQALQQYLQSDQQSEEPTPEQALGEWKRLANFMGSLKTINR